VNPPNPPDPTSAPLPAEVRAALEKGHWVEAIKLLRASGGMGLKEAKDLIDRQRAAVPAARASIADRQRAPGEVRRIPGVVWVVLIVVLAVVALVAIRLGAGPG
jgi:hypothetical protein